MNALHAAMVDVAGWLEEARVPYMVIGGFANLYWGRPRLTEDLDVTVLVEDSALSAFLEQLAKRYRLQAPDPLSFAHATRVIPVTTPSGLRVDFILAGLSYEEAAIRRARPVDVEGVTVCLCTAEDLVLHKLASDRPRDLEDVEGVIARQGHALDRDYLDPLVERLARALERPAILDLYRSSLRRVAAASAPGGT